MKQSARDPVAAPQSVHLTRLRRYAWWLDEGIRVPGTRFRIGLDPILGLVPGLGDAVGALLGAAILVEGVRRDVPRSTLVRMAANIVLDATAGSVPVLGDAFDAVWKSNSRNLALLERHAAAPLEARRKDRLFVGTLFGALIALCVGLLFGFVVLTGAVLKLLAGL